MKNKTTEVLSIEKGRLVENFSVTAQLNKENKPLFAVSEASDSKPRMVLKPRIECIHAGMTRNKTFYPADKLKGDPLLRSGVYSWTHPYPKPMIKNHDTDTEPTGRIENALYVTNTATARESIVIIPTVTDPETIEKVLDGRYLTVSIGATTDAAICSVCGTNIVEEGWCGHEKGEVYDGQEAYWIVGNLWFDECSWVNVPADQEAQVVDKGAVVMMEAYAEREGVYYDLGKKQGDHDYILTEKVAETHGLVTHKENTLPEDSEKSSGKEKEGMDEMPDPITNPEVDKAVNPEESTAGAVQDQSATPEPSDNVVEDSQTEGSENHVEEGTEDNATEQNAEENTSTSEGTEEQSEVDVESLQQRIQELESTLESAQAENQILLQQNADLSASLHRSLAERVVDLRISLGKPHTSRDEALNDFVGRTQESLKDSLADLLAEQKVSPGYRVTRESGTVTNPAAGVLDGERNQTIEESDDKPIVSQPNITTEDVLKALFSGRKSLI